MSTQGADPVRNRNATVSSDAPALIAELVRETQGMTKPLVIKWAYRYHRLEFDYFDSLKDAVSVASYAADDGQEALDCFEVWDESGYRLIGHDEAHRLIREHSDRQCEEDKAKRDQAIYVAELWVTAPDGEEVRWSAFTSIERANEVLAKLAPMGQRARLKMLPGGTQTDGGES